MLGLNVSNKTKSVKVMGDITYPPLPPSFQLDGTLVDLVLWCRHKFGCIWEPGSCLCIYTAPATLQLASPI